MKTFKTLVLAAVVTVTGAFAAQAATFDFVDLIDGPGGIDGNPATPGDTTGESTWSTSSVAGGWTVDGITLDAVAGSLKGPIYDPYLDADAAGLGVCSTLGDSGGFDCAGSSDDNVTFGEILVLDFSEAVSLTDLVLRHQNHDLFGASTVYANLAIEIYNFATGLFEVYAQGSSDLSDWGAHDLWGFQVAGDGAAYDFYISSITVAPVPLPAGGLLLLTALGGIGLARRKRKAA